MWDISGAECMCGLWAARVPLSTSGHVSGSLAGPEGQEEFCSTRGAGEVVEKEGGRGCLLALTLVALQGWGLGAELPEHGLHTPLEVQLHIWAAGVGWGEH